MKRTRFIRAGGSKRSEDREDLRTSTSIGQRGHLPVGPNVAEIRAPNSSGSGPDYVSFARLVKPLSDTTRKRESAKSSLTAERGYRYKPKRFFRSGIEGISKYEEVFRRISNHPHVEHFAQRPGTR